jgi:amidohydrolase
MVRADGAHLVEQIEPLVAARTNELIAFRRRLHAEPEGSFAEEATTDALVERLQVEGLSPVRLSTGTGVVCDIGPGDPVVVLRADIDALPLQEATRLPYRSRVPGMAHACGHDVHTAAVLGAGLVLRAMDRRGHLPHGVRLVFEPGEEQVPGGAVDVIADGWLKGIDAVFALHCDPKVDVGRVGLRVGPITSASDMVEITLTGPGGHTARPDQTVNLVDAVGRVAVDLPVEVGRAVADLGPVRLVWGAVAAGGAAANVIPTTAVLRGSLRTPTHEVWDALPDALEQALPRVLADSGAQSVLKHVRGVAPVENDERACRVMAAAAHNWLGAGTVEEAEHSWGGDSFGWFTRESPGAYLRLGTHDPAWPQHFDLHHGQFEADERSIDHGVAILALTALTAPQGMAD